MSPDLAPGQPAPAFALPRDGGGTVALGDFAGRKLVLFFYPKADTSGCTAEAQAFSALQKRFAQAGAAVLGVSPDPVKKQDAFKAKYALTVPLACDVEHRTAKDFGVWVEKSMWGRRYMGIERATFLIGPDGRLLQAWRQVKVPGHAEAVLAAVTAS